MNNLNDFDYDYYYTNFNNFNSNEDNFMNNNYYLNGFSNPTI